MRTQARVEDLDHDLWEENDDAVVAPDVTKRVRRSYPELIHCAPRWPLVCPDRASAAAEQRAWAVKMASARPMGFYQEERPTRANASMPLGSRAISAVPAHMPFSALPRLPRMDMLRPHPDPD